MKLNTKRNKTNYSNQKGITLIALVITIVVLLILAGVSINAIFSENGIIKKAQDAQNKMDQATQNDLDAVNGLSNWIDSKTNGNAGGSTGGNTTGGDTTTSDLPSVANETMPYYPDNTFTKLEGTDLSNGLVIKDAEGNEYVWIEVPKTAEVYPTAGLKITNFTVDEYTAIETDLHTYTNYYRNGTKYSDTYYSEATTGLTETKYNELKQKMLKSVYENGGFWIGRYEAGIAENRTSKDINLETAPAPLSTSKTGTEENPIYPYPYTYVTCSQAQALASKLSTGKSYTSSLMFGVQWDLVLKHIETKEVEKETALATIQSALRSDSKDWGNYSNASFTINRGKYAKYVSLSTWYDYNTALENCVTYANGTSTKISTSDYTNSILLTTGASEACKKMNIYDLAGNVWEWTLEYTASTDLPCADRGGYYGFTGSFYPASYRFNLNTTSSNSDIGFRSSLYK